MVGWIFCLSTSLVLFVIDIGSVFYCMGLIFMFYDYFVLIDYEFISINSWKMVMTVLFDWMSLFFMGGIFISSMVVYYSDSYMPDDHNSVRFILLVVLFVQ